MSDRDRVERSVDAYSAGADLYSRDHARKIADRLARFTGLLRPNAQILDAGCGPGRDLERFLAAGHQPVGIDLNPTFVAMASQFACVVEGDLRDLTSYFKKHSFAAVWASASLVHLNDDEVLVALQSFHTVLRNGGHLYSCVMSSGPTGRLKEPDGTRWYRAWPAHEFAEIVERAGFLIDEVVNEPHVEVWATRSDDGEASTE